MAQPRPAASGPPHGIKFLSMFQSDSDVDAARTPCQHMRDVFDHSGRATDVTGERPAFCDKIVDVIAGKAAPGPGEFVPGIRAANVATDSHHRIIFTEPATRSVHILDFANRKYLRIDGTKDDRLIFPFGIAVDAEDNIYVTDQRRGIIVIFNSDGKFKKYIGDFRGESSFDQPTSIAIDRTSGRIYLTETARHFVRILDSKGKNFASIGKRGGGTGPAQFRMPTELALHGQEFFVLDKRNTRIQVFDLEGHYKREFKIQSGSGVRGMAIDSQGWIYIPLDVGLIQVLDTRGGFLFNFGTYGTAEAEFKEPHGLYIDTTDRLYITDTGNQRMQIFQITDHQKRTTAGVAP